MRRPATIAIDECWKGAAHPRITLLQPITMAALEAADILFTNGVIDEATPNLGDRGLFQGRERKIPIYALVRLHHHRCQPSFLGSWPNKFYALAHTDTNHTITRSATNWWPTPLTPWEFPLPHPVLGT